MLQQYFNLTIEKLTKFKSYEILHVSSEWNTRENILFKLSSSRIFSINHSFIQETLRNLSFGNPVVMNEVDHTSQPSYITSILIYIEHGALSRNPDKAAPMKRRVMSYSSIEGVTTTKNPSYLEHEGDFTSFTQMR